MILHIDAADRVAVITALLQVDGPWWFADVPSADGSHHLLEVSIDEPAALAGAEVVPNAMVLDPSLFGGSAPPAAYVTMLERCSRRAAMLLTNGDAEPMVATELLHIHAAVAGPEHLDASLRAHADWLQRVTGSASITITEVDVRDEPPDYATSGTALRASVSDPEQLAMFASRLAHLQVVRLRGPHGGEPALLSEAAIVRSLLLQLGADAPVPPSP